MKLTSALAASALQISAALAADTAAWKARNIYFALTDRVARSSDDSGGSSCGNLGDYCGGTFQGLQGKLDYIQGMGFDAIWITPVVANTPGGYHGYWAQDLYAINSNYGTADDLKNLVNAAHEKGIYVMMDVVANHMGPNINNHRPEPLNQQSSYHSACNINYDDQNSVENCQIAGLPDLNTQDSNIRSVLNEWIGWFVGEYGFDGVRIDTVKHVEKDFWPDFAWSSGVYTIGEVFDGHPEYLAGYDGLMGGLLNYAVYYPMNRFYQQQNNSPQELVDMINTVSDTFQDPSALGSFLDNHDNARWLNSKNDQVLLQNALAFVILARGIPIVYYGTEQAYGGGADPANREDLWRSSFSTTSTMYQAISRLSAARSAHGGLPEDDHAHLYVTNGAYAWSRAGGDLVVLTTNRGSGTSGQHCFNTQRPNGSWEDVYGGAGQVTSDGNGQVCVNVSNGEPVVLSATG